MIVAKHTATLHPADLTPIGTGVSGYVRQTVHYCFVVGPQGQLISMDEVLSLSGSSGLKMALPEPPTRSDRLFVNFLWDRRQSQREAGVSRQPARRREAEESRYAAFRAFQRTILDGVTDKPLVAFLKFLDGWTPDFVEQAYRHNGYGDGNFVFRFQYDDEFLHERHAARLAWERVGRFASELIPQKPASKSGGGFKAKSPNRAR